MEKEKKLMVCRQHWATFLLKGILALFCIAVGFGGARPLIFVGLFIILYAVISYMTTYAALTETKLIGHVGFLKSKTLTTQLSKIQDIGIENGLLGKIFGYHTIVFTNAGTAGAEMVFKNMAKAHAFVDAVQKQIEKQ